LVLHAIQQRISNTQALQANYFGLAADKYLGNSMCGMFDRL
jgi:hypothetical protein